MLRCDGGIGVPRAVLSPCPCGVLAITWASTGVCVCVCVCYTVSHACGSVSQLCHTAVAVCHTCAGGWLGDQETSFSALLSGTRDISPPQGGRGAPLPHARLLPRKPLLKYSNDFRCGVGEGEAEIPSGDERAADNGAAKSLALPLSAQPHQTRHGTAWNDITRHNTASPKPQDEAPQSFQDVLPQHQGKAWKRDLETLGCPCLVPTPTP